MKIFSHIFVISMLLLTSQVLYAADGFIIKKSQYGVTESLDRLEGFLKQKGITIFARVNHSAGAKKVNIKMQPTQLLIFGNPKMGSPLMIENSLVALDLPMKVMAWTDNKNQTWLAYLDPKELQARHFLKNNKIINKMTNALNTLTNKAAGFK